MGKSLLAALALVALLAAPAQPARAAGKGLAGSGAFGATAGAITGSGLSYRQFFDDNWGAQLAGFVWSSSSVFFGDIGLQGMYTLHQSAGGRFYLPFGVGTYKVTNQSNDQTTTTTFIGVGYGMMFDIGKSWIFALDLPICLRINNTTTGGTSTGGVYPLPSVTFAYAF